MPALWQRLPVVVRAVLIGAAVATVGTVPWALLASANLKFYSSVPWAILPAALHLWLFWRYFRGDGWPRSTADARWSRLRANPLPGDVWGAAFIAGLLGLWAVMLLQRVLSRLVELPQQSFPDVSQIPVPTVAALLMMSAAVAGVVEETAFRGYMQGPIERRHGPVAAILVTGTLFGFAHFSHPEVTLILLPFYIAVAAVYGGLAYLTNSILPSLEFHAGGNVFVGIGLWIGGQSEWQGAGAREPLIWQTGTDASFWTSLAAFVAVGAAACWAYAGLAAASSSAGLRAGSGVRRGAPAASTLEAPQQST
jgi:membrane protease YdiL (CAAX protease family)